MTAAESHFAYQHRMIPVSHLVAMRSHACRAMDGYRWSVAVDTKSRHVHFAQTSTADPLVEDVANFLGVIVETSPTMEGASTMAQMQDVLIAFDAFAADQFIPPDHLLAVKAVAVSDVAASRHPHHSLS